MNCWARTSDNRSYAISGPIFGIIPAGVARGPDPGRGDLDPVGSGRPSRPVGRDRDGRSRVPLRPQLRGIGGFSAPKGSEAGVTVGGPVPARGGRRGRFAGGRTLPGPRSRAHHGAGDRAVPGDPGTSPRRDRRADGPNVKDKGGEDGVGDGEMVHQKEDPRPEGEGLLFRWSRSTLAGRRASRRVSRPVESMA